MRQDNREDELRVTDIAILNSQTHRTVRVDPSAGARLGDNQRFVPIVVGEFSLVAAHYPILFSKDSETGAFYCGAMLGFDEGENLFLSATGHDAYRPLNLQRGPFYTAGDDLVIDMAHPRVGTPDGQALFDEAGQPSTYLESIMALMRQLRPGQLQTQAFIDTLLKLKLIEPIDLNVGFDDGSTLQIEDLYTINADTLRALPDETVLDLFRRGYLQLIYAVTLSLKQVPVLAQRKNRRLVATTEPVPAR